MYLGLGGYRQRLLVVQTMTSRQSTMPQGHLSERVHTHGAMGKADAGKVVRRLKPECLESMVFYKP